jgi:hypothetical protein
VGLSPELFKRLSRLNRDLARVRPEGGAGAPQPGPREAGEAEATLEQLVPGAEQEAPGGRLYVVRRRIEEVWPGFADGPAEEGASGADFLARYRRVFFGAGRAAAPADLHEGLRPVVEAAPAAIAYLDIETCGLAGEPLFLVGLMRYRHESLQVEQFLARDYSEERPLLEAVWEALAGGTCLVTFNGKTFDLPAMEARSLACGLFRLPSVAAHVDLLHEARRRWKKVTPNCRLQTLEQMICGRYRRGDIPGGDIPAAYHDFVRARLDADPVRRLRAIRRIETIIHHNALDLVTMADLTARMLAGEAAL